MATLRRALVVGFLTAAACPAAASAATVGGHTYEVSDTPDTTYPVTAVTFVAGAGETNVVRVRAVPGGLAFKDTGAPLQPGPGCQATAPDEVTCKPLAGSDKTLGDASVDVRDGDDTVIVTGGVASVAGGTGDDVLTADPASTTGVVLDGGPGADRITGGPKGDVLVGGSGIDLLYGGAGNDVLSGDTLRPTTLPASDPADAPRDPDTASDDTIDGGPGRDTVTYEERAQFDYDNLTPGSCCGAGFPGVTVDLQAKQGGTPGEDVDRLSSIENVTGTDSDDVLLGDASANTLDGGSRGVDRIDGRAGDDTVGSEGSGTVAGGPGNDTVSSLEGTLTCGSGRDYVNPFGRYSQLGRGPAPLVMPADCEHTSFFNARLDVPVRVVGGVARLHMVSVRSKPDAGRILLLHAGQVVGRTGRVLTKATGPAGRILRAPLTSAGRRALRIGGGHTSLTLRYVFSDGSEPFTIRTTLRGR